MSFNPLELFSFSYWFTNNPPSVNNPIGYLVFFLFFVMFVLGLVSRFFGLKKAKDRYDRLATLRFVHLLLTMGLLGIILYFLSFENIRLLGARFWYPLWLLVTLVWLFFILRFIKKDIPLRRQREKEKQEREKYLPKPGKK